MQAIAERTGQFVLLAARNGDFAQYIHLLSENKVVAHPVRIGEKRELAKSGVGQVLLSSISDNDIKRLYHRINAYSGDSGKIDTADLLARLHGIRKRGYIFSKNRVMDGYGQVAFPVPQRDHVRPLAVGVGGSSDIIERQEVDIIRIVREEMERHFKKIEQPARSVIHHAAVPSLASTANPAPA
jgi:DNA-binding IclR family transcriptional regulator